MKFGHRAASQAIVTNDHQVVDKAPRLINQNSYLDLAVWYLYICQLNKNISRYWDGNAIYQVAPYAIVIFLGISLDWHHESESHESNKNNAYEAPREKRDNVLRKQFHVTWYECCSARRAKHVTIIKSEHSQIQSCPCYHSAVKAPAVLLPPQRGQPLSSMSRPIRKHS